MTFRLAHVSDLHLLGDEDERTALRGLFSSFAEYDVDHVLVTGDVSQSGDADAFRLLDEVRREYGYGPQRSTIVIGNHDLRGRRTFSRRFGGEHVKARALDGGALRLIALDSTGVNAYTPERAHNPLGWLERFQLDSLEEILASGAPERTVIALHHHVFDVPDSDVWETIGRWAERWGPLMEANDLLTILGSYGVPLVLTGHSHVERRRTITRGATRIRCQIGGATFDFETGYRFFDFVGGTLTGEGWVDLCEECWGSASVPCDTCDDDCEVRCDGCDGDGEVGCRECDDGYIPCEECDGEGEVVCGYCDEGGCGHCDQSGYRECKACDGEGEVGCPQCDESGNIECEACSGAGWVACGECEGEGEVGCSECG